jgi:hypothetical protein
VVSSVRISRISGCSCDEGERMRDEGERMGDEDRIRDGGERMRDGDEGESTRERCEHSVREAQREVAR